MNTRERVEILIENKDVYSEVSQSVNEIVKSEDSVLPHLFEKRSGVSFSVVNNFDYKETVELAERFEKKQYSIIERFILEALYIYEFLTGSLINRLVLSELNNIKWDSSDYEKGFVLKKKDCFYNIERLFRDGYIYKMAYDGESSNGPVCYMLKKEAFYFVLRGSGVRRLKKTHEYEDPLNKNLEFLTLSILEKLSLNQWHIGVMLGEGARGNNSRLVNSVYRKKEPLTKGYVLVPSLFRVKSSRIPGGYFSLIGFPVPRREDKFKDFAKVLLKTEDLLSSQENYKNPVILFIAPGLGDIVAISNYLKNDPLTEHIPIVYMLDYYSYQGNPLSFISSLLVHTDAEGERTELITHDFLI